MTTAIKSPAISFYRDVKDTTGTEITLQQFLDGIAVGTWKKEVDAVLALKGNETAQKARKLQTPNAIIAGTSNAATNTTMRELSAKMAVDFDDLGDELETVRLELNNDQHTFSCFKSIRGEGLCVIISIQPERWDEAWEGVKLYYFQKYGRIVDKGTGNISRRRFVTYDPDIFVNDRATLFKLYPKKERKAAKPPGNFIHTTNDVEFVLEQVQRRAIDLTGDYDSWYKMGFALVAEYGEGGRGYFHTLSQYNHKYLYAACDRIYTYLLRYGARQITIKTFYYHAKLAGLETMTPRTRDIARTATMQKRQKIKPDDVVNSLVKVGGVSREDATQVVTQVYNSVEEIQTDETLFDQLELFFNSNYELRQNEVTQYIENGGVPQLDRGLNSIYVAAAKLFEMKISKDNVMSLLMSDFIPTYNPLKDFFRRYAHRRPFGVIDALAETIKTDMGQTNYVSFFLRKFLVGMVSTIHGEQCPIVPVLTGGINKGKTQFWRRLFPEELRPYYGETNFSGKDTDNEILMCKKLLLMNDEFTGDLLVKHGKFKSLTDRHTFNIRKPYGKAHEDMPRLAMIAGTSNDDKILSDPTGNRRIVPINVVSIDHAAYNQIDKIDLLMEAYWAYNDGETGDLNTEQIAFLERHTGNFVDVSTERDMIEKYFSVPTGEKEGIMMSQGEILEYLNQVTGIKNMNPKTLSQEMKATGFPYSNGDYYAPEKRTKRGFWLFKRALEHPL